jgi:aspartate aminotransferase
MPRQPSLSIRPAITELEASPIREVSAYGLAFEDVIPLWFGEPDRPTPAFICEAAAEAMRAGRTFYSANRGIMPLRDALATYLARLHRRPPGIDRLTVTASGMSAVMMAAELLVDAGDSVVIVEPLWPNIAGTVRIMGGEPRPVGLEPGANGWQLDMERIEAAIDARTRAVVVNSPGNPTGWMADETTLAALLELCRRRGLWLIADEVYSRIVYEGEAAPSLLDLAEADDRVIVAGSFSKAWAMTGWRLGWLATPPELGPMLEKIAEFNNSHPPTFLQYGAIAALERGEGFVRESRDRYRAARDLVTARLGAIQGVRLPPVAAGLFAFFAKDGMTDSVAFAKALARDRRVGLAPGRAFGTAGEGWLRLCFAADPELLARALDRLEPALA